MEAIFGDMIKNIKKCSVFNYCYSTRYYLMRPWKLIKEFFQNCYHGWRRAIYGWTWEDCWNFDSWFCVVTPQILKHMADHGSAYPGTEPFDTPEKWHDWLYEMAHRIERLQYDDWMEDNNEYSKEYIESFENDWHSERQEEIRKKYYVRCQEINKTRRQVLEDFGKEFFKHFDCLWD